MAKKLLKKLGKGLKKAAPLLALGLGAAALGKRGRANAMRNSMTADMPRSMVPMRDRMVQGLNFPAGTDLSGIDKIAAAGGVANLKKGGRVGVGKAKRGFGRAMKGKK
jgi:hypothetical protein